MKKIITYIVLVFCFLVSSPAYADGVFEACNVKLVQENDDVTGIINQYISISGTVAADAYGSILTIGIIKEGNDNAIAESYSVVKQLIVDSEGNFSIDIPFQLGGNYTVRIGSEKTDVPYEVSLATASADTINEFMRGVRGEYSKSELNQAILSKGEELGFDLTVYNRISEEKQEEVCDYLLDNSSEASMEDIKEMFSSKCALVALSNQKDKALLLDILNYYKSDYGFGTEYEYTIFSDGDAQLKEFVSEKMGQLSYSEAEEVKKALYEYAVLYDIYNIEIESQMVDKITVHSSYIDSEKYSAFEKLSLAKKSKIAGYLIENEAENIADFNSKLNYVIKNYDDIFSSGVSGGGSSSGGSSGGSKPSSSIVSLPTSLPAQPGSIVSTVTVSFTDLKDTEWAKEAVEYLLDKSVVNGKEVGKFYPNDNVTRAEFVKMLMLACNITADNAVKKDFSDVTADHWSYEYINIASSRGLINGVNKNLFGVDAYITREDMATLGYRILTYLGEMFGGQSLENTFTDYNTFSDYSKNAILMLNKHGYLSGYPDNTFKPQNNVTRAEAAQFIYNLIKE